MSKIDVASIEGYESMTAEEKIAALEAYEIEVPAPKESDEVVKLKNALSNANSQAAEWKRQYRSTLDEKERAEAERAEAEKAKDERLRELERKITVGDYLANCLSLGYDKELAQRAAEAMADNDAAAIMECQREFLEAKTKELEAAALNKQPTLTPGAPPTATEAEKAAQNKTRSYFGLPPLK